MDVLEHEQHRAARAEGVEQVEHRLEEVRLGGGVLRGHQDAAARQTGEQPGEGLPSAGRQLVEHLVAVAHERAQRAHQRRVGQLAVAQLDAVAAQHERAVLAARRATARR